MAKKTSNYRLAVEKLREKHADKIEDLFLKMYQYATDKGEDGHTLGVDPKDSVNAAKVVVSLLGVPKPPTAAKDSAQEDREQAAKIKKPELPPQLKEQLTRLLNNGSTRT